MNVGDSKRGKENRWREIDGGQGFVLPMTLLRSENFVRLSPHAVKLLMDLGRQYTGHNNGDLTAAWTVMQPQGWNSKATLGLAQMELEHYGIIVRSRQGGRNRCNLFALTFRRIDQCKGKLELSPTLQPTHDWKAKRDAWKRPEPKQKQILDPRTGSTFPSRRVNHGRVDPPRGLTIVR